MAQESQPKQPDEMYCSSCGALIKRGVQFCTACGVALAAPFPVRLEADYPERLSRLSTFFRIFLAIPVVVVLYLLGQGLIGAYWIGILVRGRPVRWLFDAIVAIQRFSLRAYAFFFLLTDRYPPLDGEWPVRYEVDYPQRLSRWRLVIWKTVTVIPHVIVLGFVSIAVAAVVPIAWFAVLFTGRYPRGLHTFVSGWLRWSARAGAYWVSLTDEFPSFSFSAHAGRGSTSSYVISAIFGWLIVLVWVGAIGTIIALPGDTEETTVSYEGLLVGESSESVDQAGLLVTVIAAGDQYEFQDRLYVPEEGERFVIFAVTILSRRGNVLRVDDTDFELEVSGGEDHRPFLMTINGRKQPRELRKGQEGVALAVFEIDEQARPTELKYSPQPKKTAKFVFE